MKIFLSAELYGPAASRWAEIRKEFEDKLLPVHDIDYGTSLTNIAIISIIMRPDFFEDGGYKERKYYSRKRAEADIRLRIDYAEFMKATKERRKEIYKEHILESIRIAGEKAGNGFELDRLLSDVDNLLK